MACRKVVSKTKLLFKRQFIFCKKCFQDFELTPYGDVPEKQVLKPICKPEY